MKDNLTSVKRLQRAALAGMLAVLPLTVTACGTRGESLTRAEAAQRMTQLEEEIAQVVGQAKVVDPTNSSTPCDTFFDNSGKTRWMSGAFNILLSREADAATFETVRDHWKGLGWKINEYWYKETPERVGNVSVKNPKDGTNFTVVSGYSPTRLAVIAASGCYTETDFKE